MKNRTKPGSLAILVGGGPAPGINGVISAATIEGIKQGFEVIGLDDGYKWLAQGDTTHCRKLTIGSVKDIPLRGGSILGTSRANPTKSKESMRNVLNALSKLGVTALVSIGGDDTAFSASQIYGQARGAIRVAHVPKTIDNDLPLPGSTPTFGFETARHHGVHLLRNLAEDARTTSRWYIVISMGRTAGHLALGIAKAAAATLAVIPEEFQGRRVSINQVCDVVIGSIIKRRAAGTMYGVAVLAEGLIEAMGKEGIMDGIPSGQLNRYGKVKHDDHGHLHLGEIEFGRMMKDLLDERLRTLGIEMTLVDKDLGYELRCADPIPFDAEYTRDLGYGAVKFILSPASARFGAIVSFEDGKLVPLPFKKMLNPKTGRMTVRKVNVRGEAYECARHYMIRLERSDFEVPAQLRKLAASISLTPGRFRERFGYVVGLK